MAFLQTPTVRRERQPEGSKSGLEKVYSTCFAPVSKELGKQL
jgi:hypothetical protein